MRHELQLSCKEVYKFLLQKLADKDYTSFRMRLDMEIGHMLNQLAAGLFVEAAVVGIVCVVFLILFIVAGIKQIMSDDGRDE